LTGMTQGIVYLSTRDAFGWSRMTKILVPQGGRGGKEGVGSGWRRNTAAVMVYRSPTLLLRRFTRRVLWSFTEKLKASNSNEQLLLRVNCGMERRLQTMDGTTRTLFKSNLDALVGRKV